MKDLIKIGSKEIDLYPLRTDFENLLKLGFAIESAEFKEEIMCSVIPTNRNGLNRLYSINDEVLQQTAIGIQAISNVIEVINHDAVGEDTIKNLSMVINSFSALQQTLLDSAGILNGTNKYITKIEAKK